MMILTRTLLSLSLLASCQAAAVPILNGDFSDGLMHWVDASSTGTVTDGGGIAVLDTGDGDDPFSAVMVQGDDGFFTFPAPISLGADIALLRFDAMFEDLGVDSTEPGASPFTDRLGIALYDALDFNLDLFFDPGIDIISNGLGWLTFELDVSSLVGRYIALSFELSDQDDGRISRASIDNVVFAPAAVPLPSTLLLILAGISFVFRTRRNS